MTKRFPRVAVGGGKYCYSGPNCRQHGVQGEKGSSATATPPTPYKSVQQFITKQFDLLHDKVEEAIHEQSVNLDSLASLGQNLLMDEVAAQHCADHNTYHAYSAQAFNRAAGLRVPKEVFVEITRLQKERTISVAEATSLRGEAQEQFIQFQNDTLGIDQATVQKFGESLKGTPAWDEASTAKQNGVANHQLNLLRVFHEPGPEHPKLPADMIDPEILLEYWKCGRKNRHRSEDAANRSIRLQKKTDDINPYKCGYGDHFHLGHGDGRTPVEEQLEKAREHWDSHPEAADIFAFRKELL